MRTYRSDAWDSGNSLTRFSETWDTCPRCGEDFELGLGGTGICGACEEEQYAREKAQEDACDPQDGYKLGCMCLNCHEETERRIARFECTDISGMEERQNG